MDETLDDMMDRLAQIGALAAPQGATCPACGSDALWAWTVADQPHPMLPVVLWRCFRCMDCLRSWKEQG